MLFLEYIFFFAVSADFEHFWVAVEESTVLLFINCEIREYNLEVVTTDE